MLKQQKIDKKCIEYIIGSHNNKFLEHIIERDLFDPCDFHVDFDEMNKSQNLKAVFLLYEKDPNLIILWCASFSQTQEIIFNEKLNLSMITADRDTILHFAASANKFEICEFVLSKGLMGVNTINNNGNTPLHNAAIYNSKEAAEILLRYGAKVNAKAEYDETPLHVAAKNDSKEIAELLISHGAKINAKDAFEKTAVSIAAENNSKEVLELLLSHGADINSKDDVKLTPLHLAALNDYKEIVETLLQHGADINAKDNSGKTALELAEEYECNCAYDVLLSYNKRKEEK